jgi:ribosome silencing factor RsfS/YbeB/iojap
MLRDIQVEPTPGPEEVPHVGRTAEMSIEECVEVLREEKACNLVVIGLEGEEKDHYTSYFVTCSGLSTRHLRSMSTRLVKEMKGVQVSSVRRVFVEGEDCDDWMVVDMGNIVVHFFLEERRRELELEKLWLLGSNYDDQLRAARKTDNLY